MNNTKLADTRRYPVKIPESCGINSPFPLKTTSAQYCSAGVDAHNGNTASKTYMYNYRYSSPPYGDIESPAYYDGPGSFYDVTILDGNACSGKNVNIASVI